MQRYFYSHLEDWVSDLYIKNQIYTAKELSVENLANVFNVEVIPNEEVSVCRNSYGERIIFLNINQNPEEINADFFHELGHLLRHEGHTEYLYEDYTRYLEWDAQRFAYVAALPWHILKHYNLNDRKIVNKISSEFCLPINFTVTRLFQIKRRMEP
ncbi:ImmA/IrrE family metallo-endopeptidase [Thalassobacillus sp. C254]|uniref:ImmA/IrrE family metallo-endopeptidase n=1 Tax=Thalassobacillus sp. C254 TaxID=1225341 RepID=UPI0006D0C555|nr:ImmA/IrrE family metallo-endopeptidase [Thalassobacillus sp. C254]